VKRWLGVVFLAVLAVSDGGCSGAPRAVRAQAPDVFDVPTRPGIVERVLVLTPANPKAVVLLFAGGHGGLDIRQNGIFMWGSANFLVRSRDLFVSQGLTVVVVDAPSDHQNPPYLSGFRQTPEHVADIRALISWVRHRQVDVPVWLVGTSRGTESVAFAATELSGTPDAPDGIVLTSTILITGPGNRPVSVPAMALARITVPTLVVHHRLDGCQYCPYPDLPGLLDRLTAAPRKELITAEGGISRGDPCEAMAYHGFNGIEGEVVGKITKWIETTSR
jgi:pimeloyl-ACP methyl ester carboxylesterase